MTLARIYDLFAPLYDLLIRVPIFGLRKEQSAALAYVAGKRILEIGCGTGYLLASMARGERELVGLDFSKGMLRKARARLLRERKKASLVYRDYHNLPFEPCSFDSVVSTFSLSHAPDILPVFLEIHRVLKKNGRVVIVDVGPAARYSLGARILLSLYRLEGDHPRDETQELHRAGFRIILRKELSKLGTVHLVVAEKQSPSG
jgi:ubiquinone/menaquinone biosynthesis C-methylase UbiE